MKIFRKVADRLLNTAFALLLVGALGLGVAPAMAFDLAVNGSTATGASNAATCANSFCVVTTESVSTAAGATYLETVTATPVLATDICLASVAYGTSTTGSPAVMKVTPGAGTLAILVQNIHASAALNGTIVISYACLKS